MGGLPDPDAAPLAVVPVDGVFRAIGARPRPSSGRSQGRASSHSGGSDSPARIPASPKIAPLPPSAEMHSEPARAPGSPVNEMSDSTPTVFVVDDNPRVRQSVCTLLTAAGLRSEAYASARAFLAAYDPSRPGCLVLDLRLRGENGLELQDELRRRKAALPIIVLTAHGTVPASVRALKAGAIEFLQKPAPPATLLARIRDALAMDESARQQTATRATRERRLARLTPRERQVLNLLLSGKNSKEIATGLGLSVRTVQGYRAAIYVKTEVSSVAQLVRVVLAQE